jgi:hypothetical protein
MEAASLALAEAEERLQNAQKARNAQKAKELIEQKEYAEDKAWKALNTVKT